MNNTELEISQKIQDSNLIRKFIARTSQTSNPRIDIFEGREVINFSSNDYLRMSKHPSVIAAMVETLQNQGVGSGGTRNISGTTNFHNQLEKDVALLHEKESALLFNSAYNANFGALSALGSMLEDVCFFSDSKNHACIIDGIRLSRAAKVIYPHSDLDTLEKLVSQSNHKNKIIVCESVYSMNGTVTDLARVSKIAKKYGCFTFVDEVHAVGLYGSGAGIAKEQGVSDEIDIINGTFGKAFGVLGGYVAGKQNVIEFIRLHAKSFIFTTSLPPSLCHAASVSIQNAGQNRPKFFENVRNLKSCLDSYGINYAQNSSHIVSIVIGGVDTVREVCKRLLDNFNIYTQPIFYPTVAIGREMIRLTPCPFHTAEDFDKIGKSLSQIFNDLGIVKKMIAISRGSTLARAQLEFVIQKFSDQYPQGQITSKIVQTYGDKNLSAPIRELKYTNPFTKEIEDEILQGSADLGVSSLKDVEILSENGITVKYYFDRKNPRDVLVLNDKGVKKIGTSEQILIGTSSLRREFLFNSVNQEILPKSNFKLTNIRGNVDTRLSRMDLDGSEKYVDGVILSGAGLYRAEEYSPDVARLLANKKIIILPLTHFPTPPGQGAICGQVMENHEVLDRLNIPEVEAECIHEKKIFMQYGVGCKQGYGVSKVVHKGHSFTIVKGVTESGKVLDEILSGDTRDLNLQNPQIVLTKDLDLVRYENLENITIPRGVDKFFVAHHRCLSNPKILAELQNAKEIWCSGVKTHRAIAKAGLICNGSAESFGFDYLANVFRHIPQTSPDINSLCYVSYLGCSRSRKMANFVASYRFEIDRHSQNYFKAKTKLENADIVIWYSRVMYEEMKSFVRPNAVHCCMMGDTYNAISADGLKPMPFLNANMINNFISQFSLT